MARPKLPLFLFCLVACVPLSAQSATTVQPHQTVLPAPIEVDEAASHGKPLPEPSLLPAHVPFAIDTQKSDTAKSIQVLTEDQMTSHDRDLVADAEASIQEKAGFENLEFNGGGWTYHQLVCPALPNHLFLRFTRDDGTRAMSMFSAAVPRNGEGRIHIIPIVRKGYSLFSPAPIGALTIAAFNRIRHEEGAGASADWVGTGLCYAALAGANPQAGEIEAGKPELGGIAATIPPTLVVSGDGGAVIRFADLSAALHPMEWNMIFDRKGKLLKATHRPADVARFGKTTVKTLDVSEATPSAMKQP